MGVEHNLPRFFKVHHVRFSEGSAVRSQSAMDDSYMSSVHIGIKRNHYKDPH